MGFIIPLRRFVFGAAERLQLFVEARIRFLALNHIHHGRQSGGKKLWPALLRFTLLYEALVQHSPLVAALAGTGKFLTGCINNITCRDCKIFI